MLHRLTKFHGLNMLGLAYDTEQLLQNMLGQSLQLVEDFKKSAYYRDLRQAKTAEAMLQVTGPKAPFASSHKLGNT